MPLCALSNIRPRLSAGWAVVLLMQKVTQCSCEEILQVGWRLHYYLHLPLLQSTLLSLWHWTILLRANHETLCHRLCHHIIEHTCANAQWAHMHRFLFVRLSVT